MGRPSRFYLGLDLGQTADYSAAVGLDARRDGSEAVYNARYIHRWPLRTPYRAIVQDVCALLGRTPLRDDTTLVVDATGVGAGVTEMLDAAGLQPVRVTITAGQTAHETGRDCWHVPKVDLVGTVAVLLQSARLGIAADQPEAATLTRELQGFRAKITAHAYTAYGAGTDWRTEAHDDLVLSLAVAAWAAEHIRPAGVWFLRGGPPSESEW